MWYIHLLIILRYVDMMYPAWSITPSSSRKLGPPNGRSLSRRDSANRPLQLLSPPNHQPPRVRVLNTYMEDLNPAPEVPSSTPPHPPRVRVSEMEISQAVLGEDPASWEWGNLLDFTIEDDDPLILSWDSEDQTMSTPPPPLPPPPPLVDAATEQFTPTRTVLGSSDRVRKRDPRLVCSNYLAGRIPCACPEMDAIEVEEEEEVEDVVAGARKRSRTVRASGTARCQVPGCEADIRELKGYHRRHRVCLPCANAVSVVIDGEPKRYCQQCGKFHLLPDFDEGKRSCRRKLERHNKRRRRRPTDFTSTVEKETEPLDLPVYVTCHGEPRKEMSDGLACETAETVLSNKILDRETLLESEDGHGSPFCSIPISNNVQSHNVLSFAASGDSQIEERSDNPKSSLSSTISDNKSAYSSLCPTGRISFKLYDWNPAEFPRRLRHQIFQWLASMPVELEGYIRPGCTILTVFIAMPQFMWEKLSQEAALYVRDLVNAPESLFSGRDNMLIYLSNMIVQVLKDGTSLMNIKMEVQVPRLHYVYPTYFEAGKPMEFVACGSNLEQPKFRFLVSFAGKYLVYDSCHAISHGSCDETGGNSVRNSEHEMFRINISQTESKVFGPAFIEVENESGLSNFIPILLGNKHICSELERMQGAFGGSPCANSIVSQFGVISGLCKVLVSKQTTMSELLLDIAWLVKEPRLDKNEVVLSSTHFKRLTHLLKYLTHNKSVRALQEILHYFDNMIGGEDLDKSVNKTYDADMRLFMKHLNHAREVVHQGISHDVSSELDSRISIPGVLLPQSDDVRTGYALPSANQDRSTRNREGLHATTTPASQENDENTLPVTKERNHKQHYYQHLGIKSPRDSWVENFRSTVTSTRLAVLVMVGVVMCLGACVVLLHPHKAGEFAVTIRRCLFGGPTTVEEK